MRRGKLFAFSRFFVRLKIGRWTAEIDPPSGPTVYVCSHGNMAGPLATLCWLPFPVRPWVFHVFTDRKTCYEQFSGYTFSKRFGLPQPLANFLAAVVSGYVSTLMASTGAIPVYRGSVHIGATFRETTAALQAGDNNRFVFYCQQRCPAVRAGTAERKAACCVHCDTAFSRLAVA